MDKQLACRLSHASRLAYAIPATGDRFVPSPDVNNDIQAVGFKLDTFKFIRPTAMDNINACYCGVTTNGETIVAFRDTLPPTLIFKDLGSLETISLRGFKSLSLFPSIKIFGSED